jgi:hypothetical protein
MESEIYATISTSSASVKPASLRGGGDLGGHLARQVGVEGS